MDCANTISTVVHEGLVSLDVLHGLGFWFYQENGIEMREIVNVCLKIQFSFHIWKGERAKCVRINQFVCCSCFEICVLWSFVVFVTCDFACMQVVRFRWHFERLFLIDMQPISTRCWIQWLERSPSLRCHYCSGFCSSQFMKSLSSEFVDETSFLLSSLS